MKIEKVVVNMVYGKLIVSMSRFQFSLQILSLLLNVT